MRQWTENQVKSLAKNATAALNAEALAKSSLWESLGYSSEEQVIWGQIKGSSSVRYQVAVNVDAATFLCTCPSRQFPCKYGLALLWRFSVEAEKFDTAASIPAEVAQWVAKSRKKSTVPQDPAPALPEQVSKANDKRMLSVQAGFEDLQLWLEDLISEGMIQAPEKYHNYWDQAARRLVDAKAAGIALIIKNLAFIDYTQVGWQKFLLNKLAYIQMVLDAFKHIEQLPPLQAWDLKHLIGWTTQRKNIVDSQQFYQDKYLVLAVAHSQVDQIFERQVWVYGEKSEQIAVFIEYAPKGSNFEGVFFVGQCFEASIAFYPSALPRRALLIEQGQSQPPFVPQSSNRWTYILEKYALAISHNPFQDSLPALIGQVVLQKRPSEWVLVDAEGQVIPLHLGFKKAWELFALSFCGKITLFGLYQDGYFLPKTVLAIDDFIDLED